MADERVTIEAHAEKEKLTLYEAFVSAWRWERSLENEKRMLGYKLPSEPDTVENRKIIVATDTYRKTKVKPSYAIRFENEVLNAHARKPWSVRKSVRPRVRRFNA